MPDDVARTLIVAPNIGEDVLQERQVGRVLREQDLGGLGVAQDRSQRLIELVGDRSRQRAGGRGSVQMDDLQQAAAGFEFARFDGAAARTAARRSTPPETARRQAPLSPASGIGPTGPVGRKRMSLPAGRLLSLIPKRCSCRQSNTGLMKSPSVMGMSAGLLAAENAQYDPRGRLTDQEGWGQSRRSRHGRWRFRHRSRPAGWPLRRPQRDFRSECRPPRRHRR